MHVDSSGRKEEERQQLVTQLPLPGKFDDANSLVQTELWAKWAKRFERYRVASGLQAEPQREQVTTLLYAIGDCADDMLTTLNIRLKQGVCSCLRKLLQKAIFGSCSKINIKSLIPF